MIYDWPSGLNPNSAEWGVVTLSKRTESPLTAKGFDLSLPGDRWVCTLGFRRMFEKSRELELMAHRLSKAGNTVRLPDFAYKIQGVGGGAPLIKGASQSGLTLTTDGWPASTTDVLKAGDLIGLDTDQLCRVDADVNSDAGGNATITLVSPLRDPPTDNSAVVINAPTAKFRFATRRYNAPRSAQGRVEFSLQFIEEL